MKDIFRKYLEEAIGEENSRIAFSAFEQPASVSVRLNPSKPVEWNDGQAVAWSPFGRLLAERPQFTLDPRFHAGAYYVQDSSSMFVGHIFRHFLKNISKPDSRPVRVLDLCAAPGGKTTDLAASLRSAFGGDFLLVANEVMKKRVGVLADNVALWGDPNVAVTSDDPADFGRLEGFFDIILADVPCSGEGMFRKDEEALRQWSEDNVALCEARQKRIVADVWKALAPDGLFVYSTCTFNKRENDGNVSWIAEELGAEILTGSSDCLAEGVIKTEYGYSLVPGLVPGEGQYCAALRKKGGNFAKPMKVSAKQQTVKAIEGMFKIPMSVRMKGDMMTAVPSAVAQDVAAVESALHLIAAGCAVGTMKGKDLVPDADLALCIELSEDAYPYSELDRQTALAYLHRDTINLPDATKGFVIVGYEGLPLGFVKNLGNRCNNLHPQSRRIRMEVKDR